MSASLIVRLVTSVTASLILGLGIVLLTGFFLPPTVPENYRIILGVVMVLYGVYRLIMVWMHRGDGRIEPNS